MDALAHMLHDHPALYGVIALASFGFSSLGQRRPLRPVADLMFCVVFGLYAVLKISRIWPSSLGSSAILVGAMLAGLGLGLWSSRWGSITVTSDHDMVFEQSVRRRVLIALMITAVVFALIQPLAASVGCAVVVAFCAWVIGNALGLWQRAVHINWQDALPTDDLRR